MNQNLQKTKNKIAIPVAFSKSADPIHEKKSKVANFLNEKKQSLQSLGLKLSPQKFQTKDTFAPDVNLSEEEVYSEFARYDRVYTSRRSTVTNNNDRWKSNLNPFCKENNQNENTFKEELELHNKPYKSYDTGEQSSSIQLNIHEKQREVGHDDSNRIYQNVVRGSKTVKDEVSETNQKENP